MGFDPNTTKPEIDFPEGAAPTELVIEDLLVGDGAEAKAGDSISAIAAAMCPPKVIPWESRY